MRTKRVFLTAILMVLSFYWPLLVINNCSMINFSQLVEKKVNLVNIAVRLGFAVAILTFIQHRLTIIATFFISTGFRPIFLYPLPRLHNVKTPTGVNRPSAKGANLFSVTPVTWAVKKGRPKWSPLIKLAIIDVLAIMDLQHLYLACRAFRPCWCWTP